MQITSKIMMDLQNPGVMPILFAVQEDRYSRDLEITLTEGGRCWPIPEGTSVLIRFRKSDGRGGEYDTLPDGSPAWRAEKNRLWVALAPQVLTMPGNVRLTITLLRGESRLSTFAICLRVDPAAGGEGILSEDYSRITGFLPLPEQAAPGQLLQVAQVDDRGRVTQVAAAPNLPGDWEKLLSTEILSLPGYTNQIPLSLDAQGNPLGAEGWISGYMGDDGAFGDGNACVTGFIPVRKGDVIRIRVPGAETISSNVKVALYPDSRESAGGRAKYLSAPNQTNGAFGVFTMEGDMVTWDTSTVNYWLWADFRWLRIQTSSPETIVTVNEPMTEILTERLSLKEGVKVPRACLDSPLYGGPLAGQTIVAFGDSILAQVRDASSILSVVAERTGATVHNVAFGGCRMAVHPTEGYAAFSMWALAKAIADRDWTVQDAQVASGSSYFPEQLEKLKAIDFSGVDGVILHFGTNDFTGGVGLDHAGDLLDCSTLCGALRYSIETLLGSYPRLRLFLSLPIYRFRTGEDGSPIYAEEDVVNGHGLKDFCDAIKAVAEEYHLPVIDCYGGAGINRVNAAALLPEGVHPNATGRKLLGEFLAGQLR